MNAFQILVITLIALLVIATLDAVARGGIRKRVASFWLAVWLSAGVALAWPHSTALVARALGIGRGADLVLYCSVFAGLVGFFYIYTRFRRLDRQITELVRRLAIANAQLPEGGDRKEGAGSPVPEA